MAGTAPTEITKMDPGRAVQLQSLHELREAGLLSQEEYAAKRVEIIASL